MYDLSSKKLLRVTSPAGVSRAVNPIFLQIILPTEASSVPVRKAVIRIHNTAVSSIDRAPNDTSFFLVKLKSVKRYFV